MSTTLTIAIVTQGLSFQGDTPYKASLGGSETAVVSVARELARRGHRVMVFCNSTCAGEEFDGVSYFNVGGFSKVAHASSFDVLISSRWPEFLTKHTHAGLRVFWIHDTLVDRSRVAAQVWQTDQIFALSDFHIANYTEGEKGEKLPQFKDFFWKTSNGVDMELIKANLRPKERNKVIYTSRPERGLHFLLQHILPEVLKEVPDLKLYYCNYDLGAMQVPDTVAAKIALSEQLAQQYPDNVFNLGHLSKDRLYQEISSSQLLLYPTDFAEISCITAMEAQACGTPIISTEDFALVETIAHNRSGYLIKGHPNEQEYRAKFIRKTLQLLKLSDLRNKLSAAGPVWIEDSGFTWAQVAESWEKRFLGLMTKRHSENIDAVCLELERRSDLVMAREFRAGAYGPDDECERLSGLIDQASRRSEPEDGPSVVEGYRAAIPRFRKVLDLLAHRFSRVEDYPSLVWDWQSGDVSFAYFYVQAIPHATAAGFDENPNVIDRLEKYVSEHQNEETKKRVSFREAVTFTELQEEAAPNLLFLGDVLERVEHPHLLLQTCISLVGPGGYIAATSSYGAQSATPGGVTHERIWNLAREDYAEMCPDINIEMNHIEENISPGGDVQGHWILAFQVPEEPGEINPISKARRLRQIRPYQSMRACCIARDAQDWILKMLRHLTPIADHTVIALDDRTSDRTEELIREFYPEVEVRPIAFDNFSQARNASRQGADEDWILWVDTDEMVQNAPKLRRYLAGPMFEGYAIEQCHLMLDVNKDSDNPVRLFRNRERYKWVGYIHEHCEDTSKGEFDNPIDPVMLLPDVKLAHYGYPDERERRIKCSNRNMRLLRRDLEDHPERKLNKVLAMRDCINLVKWRISSGLQVLARGSDEHMLVQTTIRIFLRFFSNPMSKHHGLSYPMYQEALGILGLAGIPFENRAHPPFSIACGLGAAIGRRYDGQLEANPRWYVDKTEYLEYADMRHQTMLAQMGIISHEEAKKTVEGESQVEYEWDPVDVIEMIDKAIDVIHEATGLMGRV